MDLQRFREIVDRTPIDIAAIRDQPEQLYTYVGLNFETSFQQKTVSEALADNIKAAFKSGHRAAVMLCRSFITDLIREHVLFGSPLDPYYDVLTWVRDAVRPSDTGGEIEGDWEAAIKAARDSIELSGFSMSGNQGGHAREYNVAYAAKALRQAGYAIRLEHDHISVEESAQASLVAEIESLVAEIGGISVARRLFAQIGPLYDAEMGRYHIVPSMSLMGGGDIQIPCGYILQLAVKHLAARVDSASHEAQWSRLLMLVSNYAAVIDVQPYYPAVWGAMEAKALIKYLQEQALYDSMFRFIQLRASDVLKICRGAFAFLDPETLHPHGWKLSHAFEVIGYLTSIRFDVRGPLVIDEKQIQRGLPHIPKAAITAILRQSLSHPVEGANQYFSLPTDAPAPDDKTKGADFYLKPLIRRPGNRYLIVDRSMCGWGYLEALLSALRSLDRDLDSKVGVAMEQFVQEELAARGMDVLSGDYDQNGHGECDIAVPTPQVLFFMEMKKKTLTRRAKAGIDAELLIDLAGSMLDAHAQAGWHELRITKVGHLDLSKDGGTRRLSLEGRAVEKIALGMLDFGSFQDRVVLKQFLEATLAANFGSPDPVYNKKLKKLNAALDEIREQYNEAHAGKTEIRQPFFNCWFMSIPQLLVLLDEVSDAESFKKTIWSYRHMVTGTSDFFYEMSRARRMHAAVAAEQVSASTKANSVPPN